jgi:hypothetical protein
MSRKDNPGAETRAVAGTEDREELMGTGFLGVIGMSWTKTESVVAQHRKCAKCTELHTFLVLRQGLAR